jgi:hypothetical protein
MALTQVDQGLLSSTAQYTGFKNRIINGAMVIDQRNAGASVTPTFDGQYGSCDRWNYWLSQVSKFSTQQSTTAPTGFSNSILLTSLSSYSVTGNDYFTVNQKIEGFNFADMMWGTANAQTVTLSFWVRSSLTGTFGGAMTNSAFNRSYPFSYTISAANTWEQKTITIAGDTSGTWVGASNGIGVIAQFSIGAAGTSLGTAGAWTGSYKVSATGATSVVGTSGATFYITGVQLEKGSTATSFDYRPYGTELNLCLRYFAKSYEYSTALATATTVGMVGGAPALSSLGGTISIPFFTQMRTAPTMAFWDSAGTASRMTGTTNGTTMTNGLVSTPNGAFNISQNNFWITGNGNATYSMFIHYTASAEL